MEKEKVKEKKYQISGILEKKSKKMPYRKLWQSRFFAIDQEDNFIYFKSEKSKQPKFKRSMQYLANGFGAEHGADSRNFIIVFDLRTFFLRAENEETKISWLEFIDQRPHISFLEINPPRTKNNYISFGQFKTSHKSEWKATNTAITPDQMRELATYLLLCTNYVFERRKLSLFEYGLTQMMTHTMIKQTREESKQNKDHKYIPETRKKPVFKVNRPSWRGFAVLNHALTRTIKGYHFRKLKRYNNLITFSNKMNKLCKASPFYKIVVFTANCDMKEIKQDSLNSSFNSEVSICIRIYIYIYT